MRIACCTLIGPRCLDYTATIFPWILLVTMTDCTAWILGYLGLPYSPSPRIILPLNFLGLYNSPRITLALCCTDCGIHVVYCGNKFFPLKFCRVNSELYNKFSRHLFINCKLLQVMAKINYRQNFIAFSIIRDQHLGQRDPSMLLNISACPR